MFITLFICSISCSLLHFDVVLILLMLVLSQLPISMHVVIMYTPFDFLLLDIHFMEAGAFIK